MKRKRVVLIVGNNVGTVLFKKMVEVQQRVFGNRGGTQSH